MIKVDLSHPSGIIWIASYPKSGNTWVRVFLHNLMLIQDNARLDDTDLDQVAQRAASEASLVALFQEFLGKPITDATVQQITAARPKVHEAVKKRSPSVALLKTHNILGQIFGIPTVNLAATAGAVYVVRNPLDIVLSLQDHLGSTLPEAILAMESENFATLTDARQVFEMWGSWSQQVQSWTQKKVDPILVLRYEDMLDNPVPTFTSIARHLRQAPSEEQIALAIERSAFKRLTEQEQKVGFKEKTPRSTAFFRVGRAGQWRDKLTEEQVRRIVARHHEQMQRFGYLSDELARFVPARANA